MDTMSYKAQFANIEFSAADDLFIGRLLGINDVVSFHADNLPDLNARFEDAVNDYLEICAKVGKPPQKLQVEG